MGRLLVLLIIVMVFVGCVCDNLSSHPHLTAKDVPVFKGTPDMIAYQAHMWVTEHITYREDELDGHADYWQTSEETMKKRTGDCEDGAILTAHILLASGIKFDRIKVVGGYVQDDEGLYGHAYCLYKRTKDNEWITLDWCVLPDNYMPINTRIPVRFKSTYKKVLFYIIGE